MDWYRWHNGTHSDPKWRVVARKADSSLPAVVAVWAAICENANQSPERGTLSGWDAEDVAAALDLDMAEVGRIVEAMQGKVLDGERLTGWEARNPKREDLTAASRKRRQRSRSVTQSHAPEESRGDTEESREEENREEKVGGNPDAVNEQATDPQAQAQEEMRTDANAFYETLPPEKRTGFKAEVRGVVSGDRSQAWKNGKTGLPIPWEDRPARLRLAMDALAKGAAESLHWALVFVHKQEDDPLELRSAAEIQAERQPKAGTEHATVRSEYPQEARRTATTGGLTPIAGPAPEPRPTVDLQAERIRRWEEENPETVERIRAGIAAQVASGATGVPKGDRAQQAWAVAEYRDRVLKILNREAA